MQPVIVVAAAAHQLPLLQPNVTEVHYLHPDRGPLEGLAAGLMALPAHAEAAFVASCDLPLVSPAFIGRMIELLGDADAAVPWFDNHLHGLAAVYRHTALDEMQRMLSENCLRLQSFFERIRTRGVGAEELRDVDPELRSLWNINSPDDLRAALADRRP